MLQGPCVAYRSTDESHAPEGMQRKTKDSVGSGEMQATRGIQAQKGGPQNEKQWLPAQVGHSRDLLQVRYGSVAWVGDTFHAT